MVKKIFIPILAVILCGTIQAARAKPPKPMQVEDILLNQKLWETKLESFAKHHHLNGFKYMSSAKKAVRAEGKNFTFFGKQAGEVVLRSNKDLISDVNISLYNRGDNGEIKLKNLMARYDYAVAKITEVTGQKPRDMSGKKTVELTRMLWMWENSAILVERSTSAKGVKPEFLRIRIKAQNARSGGIANRSSLRSNLVKDRDSGDVYIENIPMIDQGKKGYCAVASAARVYQYYGLDTDQHMLAQIAGTKSRQGTSLGEMVSALKKVTRHVRSRVLVLYEYPKGLADKMPDKNSSDQEYMRLIRNYELGLKEFARDIKKYDKLAKKKNKQTFSDALKARGFKLSKFISQCDPEIYREVMTAKSSYTRFVSKIEEYIDQGIPIGWCLQLGMFKEGKLPQMFGGHMRLIIGYNKKTKEVIYTDSWGAGHAKKRMPVANAFCMSNALLVLPPNK